MGRLKDALDALRGRLPSQSMARIEAEWAAIQLDVANVMEQVGRWAGREAKRAQREAKKLEPPQPAQLELTAPPSRKAELRRKVAGLRGLPAPTETTESEVQQ